MSQLKLEEIYDRQLRLWGLLGQQNIEDTTLCFLGSNTLSAEIAKNLALTGIGHIIFIDDALVTDADIKENFFVEIKDIGKPRCESVASTIRQLNQFIKVEAINNPASDIGLLDSLLFPYSFVVTTTNLSNTFLNQLSEKCRKNKWVQVHVQVNGFFGEIAIDAGPHISIEGFANDPEKLDLRLSNPFPAFSTYLESHQLSSLPPEQLSKAPFIFIIYEALKRIQPNESSSLEEKVKMIQNEVAKIGSQYSGRIEPEIFDEITRPLIRETIQSYSLPNDVEEAFQNLDEMESKQLFEDTVLWAPIRAIYEFYKRHKVLPQYGVLRDFECTPSIYQELKAIFKAKMLEDEKEVSDIIAEMNGGLKVDPEILRRYIKSVNRLNVILYKPLSQTLGNVQIDQNNDFDIQCQHLVQKLFWSGREFKEKFGKEPGTTKEDWEMDVDELRRILGDVQNIDENTVLKFTREFCAKKGLILTSVAGTTGGMASQEIIKLAAHTSSPLKKGVAVINYIWDKKNL